MDNSTDKSKADLHEKLRKLYQQFMHGEISQGKMAEELGISRIDLIHLLEELGLQVTNL